MGHLFCHQKMKPFSELPSLGRWNSAKSLVEKISTFVKCEKGFGKSVK